MDQHVLKGKAVETHPLSRSSSSSSSLDGDFQVSQLSSTECKTSSSRRGRAPTVGRFRDFLSKSDDQSKADGYDGNMYYNIWQNKSKILSNLKKQATESVRQLTQSTSLDTGSNQGFFFKSQDDSAETPQKNEPVQKPTNQAGLLKVVTDNITENSVDNDVSSYLQDMKENASDPLTVLRQKEEEEEKQKEEDFFDEPLSFHRDRAATVESVSPSTLKETGRKMEINRPVRRILSNSSSSKKSTMAVSLSSLMAGKPDNMEDEIIAENQQQKENKPVEMKEKKSIARVIPESPDELCQELRVQEVPDPPSLKVIFVFTFLLFLYYILPLPTSFRIACCSFVIGSLCTAAFLCVFASRSRRPEPFLPPPINSSIPYSLPLSIYDPDQLIRGWLNEISLYDPHTYHVSNTTSVFVTLDGSTLRLQTPQKSIPRRSVYSEGNIPITNVAHQRMFDLTFAKVYLQPSGLVKKRVWSKKYPICVKIPCGKTSDSFKDTLFTKNEENHKDAKFVYLFGRTDRQKEQWFYRIQRSINNAFCKHKRGQKTNETKQKRSESALDTTDEWAVIEDHYEEEIYTGSSVCDITKHSDQPVKLLQDYFVHISRLFPQDSAQGSPTTNKDSEENKMKLVEENRISWLNVILGRIMFDFLRQPAWTKWLSVKVQRKLDKIKLPYFIGELKLTEMNLGSSVPLLHEISLPKLDSKGIWISAEITYSGAAQMTLKTKLVLTKLGKNETLLPERETSNRSSAITDSDAEDSAESSDDEESTVSRFVGQMQNAVSRFDSPQIFKDALKSMGGEQPSSEVPSYSSSPMQPETMQPQGAPPKKWIRIVDSIAKSNIFQKAKETEFLRKKFETVSNTPMLLTVELVQLKGTLVINIPPPPTDRIWYGFREPPTMLLKAQPKVGERVVKTTHVTDWIESKLQQEVTKFLVMPNMDDIPIPIMFHNRRDPS